MVPYCRVHIIQSIGLALSAAVVNAQGEVGEVPLPPSVCPYFAPVPCVSLDASPLERECNVAEKIRSMGNRELDDALSVDYAQTAATGSRYAAARVKCLIAEKERRRPPKGFRSTAAYAAFLLSGQVDQAVAERQAKELDVPDVDFSAVVANMTLATGNGMARYWYLDEDAQWSHWNIDLAAGNHIVVYASAICGHCMLAATAISQDPLLQTAFRKYAVWIETPDASFGSAQSAAWRKRLPLFPLYVIFDRNNWPERDIAATPYFFVYKAGRLQAKFVGWTSETASALRKVVDSLMDGTR